VNSFRNFVLRTRLSEGNSLPGFVSTNPETLFILGAGKEAVKYAEAEVVRESDVLARSEMDRTTKFKNVWQGKEFKSCVFVSVAGKGVRGAFFRMCGK
jgi:hypothetical protein